MFKHRHLACAVAVVASHALAGPGSAAPHVDTNDQRAAGTASPHELACDVRNLLRGNADP